MSAKKPVDIDECCTLIEEGYTWQALAKHFDISITQLWFRINQDPIFSARAREARTTSADAIADKAEEVLKSAPNDPGELQRARELAQHYRWKSGKRNPKEYGDKVQQDVNVTGITSRIID